MVLSVLQRAQGLRPLHCPGSVMGHGQVAAIGAYFTFFQSASLASTRHSSSGVAKGRDMFGRGVRRRPRHVEGIAGPSVLLLTGQSGVWSVTDMMTWCLLLKRQRSVQGEDYACDERSLYEYSPATVEDDHESGKSARHANQKLEPNLAWEHSGWIVYDAACNAGSGLLKSCGRGVCQATMIGWDEFQRWLCHPPLSQS